MELKNNVKKAWWKKFVQENPYNVGLDAAILMNPQTWVTTGHVAGFSDPLLDCRACKARHRADKQMCIRDRRRVSGRSGCELRTTPPVCFADSPLGEGASGEEMKLYALPKPPSMLSLIHI